MNTPCHCRAPQTWQPTENKSRNLNESAVASFELEFGFVVIMRKYTDTARQLVAFCQHALTRIVLKHRLCIFDRFLICGQYKGWFHGYRASPSAKSATSHLTERLHFMSFRYTLEGLRQAAHENLSTRQKGSTCTVAASLMPSICMSTVLSSTSALVSLSPTFSTSTRTFFPSCRDSHDNCSMVSTRDSPCIIRCLLTSSRKSARQELGKDDVSPDVESHDVLSQYLATSAAQLPTSYCHQSTTATLCAYHCAAVVGGDGWIPKLT